VIGLLGRCCDTVVGLEVLEWCWEADMLLRNSRFFRSNMFFFERMRVWFALCDGAHVVQSLLWLHIIISYYTCPPSAA
jgi:hypothetical protein